MNKHQLERDKQPHIVDCKKHYRPITGCPGLELRVRKSTWKYPLFTLRSSIFSAGCPAGSTDSPFIVGKIMPCVNSEKKKSPLLEVIS